MSKVYFKPEWFYDIRKQQLIYFSGGYFEEGSIASEEEIEKSYKIVIHRQAYYDLLDFIRKNEKGVLATDREEDLKIIHKLLEIAKINAEKRGEINE